MNKEQFVNKLKDPINAEAIELGQLIEEYTNGNKIEIIDGESIMYITVFVTKEIKQENFIRELEIKIKRTARIWWLEAIQYIQNESQISMGFRLK